MRKLMVAALSVVLVSYYFLAEKGEQVDETTLIVAAPLPTANTPPEFDSTRSGGPDKADEPETSTPLQSNALARPVVTAPGSETLPATPYVIPDVISALIDPDGTATTDPDKLIEALYRLADHNTSRLLEVLSQTLEVDDVDDVDFHEFVLATLDELGEKAPGEILAALIRTAPTPELRRNALRLLAQASQELSLGPFRRALEHPDPVIRQSATTLLDGLGANALLEAVAGAVLDRNQMVQLNAFSTLEEMSQFTPVWDVADLAVNDPDPRIRMRALELLTYGGPEAAIDQLMLALGDPNPQVSELAGALLSEFEQGPS